jgi:hypothetical protein
MRTTSARSPELSELHETPVSDHVRKGQGKWKEPETQQEEAEKL